MKAQLLNDFGGVDQFTVGEVPTPDAGSGQVRIRVHAIGINPMDIKIRNGWLRDVVKTSFPAILGSDVAGVIDQIGDGVTGRSVGDRVVGLTESGAYAEYTLIRDDIITSIPDTLGFEHAVTIPTAAETARRVIKLLDPQAGETVVVSGAAGSVGSAAVQLLARDNVNVIATASENNHDYLRRLGANPTTYGEGVTDRIRELAPDGVDAIFDVTGQDFIDAAITLRGGAERIVTISDFDAADRGITVSAGDASQITSADFAPVVALAASGEFATEIAQTFEFDDLPAAHELSETGHLRGKIVVTGPLSPGSVYVPGDEHYDDLVVSWNSIADQRPALVARPPDAGALARVVAHASRVGLRVAVQGTGHGASGRIGNDVALISTADLQSVQIDPVARTASVGAGVTWGTLASAAAQSGLAGLAGTAPTVGVAGYLMGGGLGWLTRRHGLASASLLAVDYVDVDGTERRTDETEDADVLWSFRGGGGGAGIATRLHLRLFEYRSLHAGARFWAIEHLPEVLNSWLAWTEGAPTSVTSMCWALQAPDVPEMHEALRGRAVVAVGACVVDADDPEAIMRSSFAGLPQPLMDTYADRRADQLGDIHLDPPGPVPALGDGRLISRPGADEALAAFKASAIQAEGPLTLVELRHLGGATSSRRSGAHARRRRSADRLRRRLHSGGHWRCAHGGASRERRRALDRGDGCHSSPRPRRRSSGATGRTHKHARRLAPQARRPAAQLTQAAGPRWAPSPSNETTRRGGRNRGDTVNPDPRSQQRRPRLLDDPRPRTPAARHPSDRRTESPTRPGTAPRPPRACPADPTRPAQPSRQQSAQAPSAPAACAASCPTSPALAAPPHRGPTQAEHPARPACPGNPRSRPYAYAGDRRDPAPFGS
ncbi:MAG: FAD-binding protein [Actinomycetota bacterium]|nr:FAD-binding protein [Actinomycetota bacterium]